MRRLLTRPSAPWRTFLEAHIRDIVAVDFFVVPTLTFHLLFGFLILRHHLREVVRLDVTDHPTAAWTAHQLVESRVTRVNKAVKNSIRPTVTEFGRRRDTVTGRVGAQPSSLTIG